MLSAMSDLTRDELHDLVWSVPGTALAKRFGISDVGLAKICRRHEIPRPPRGHWARVRAGKRVSRKPLPPLSLRQRDLRTITIYQTQLKTVSPAKAIAPAAPGKRQPEEDSVKQPSIIEERIVVPGTLRKPHEILRPAIRRRGGNKAIAETTLRQTLHGSFCRKCYGRALRSLDTLFKTLEQQGFPVEVNSWESPPQFVTSLDGNLIAFKVQEDRKEERRRRRIPPDERRSWFREPYETRFVDVCTGRLIFRAEGGWGRSCFFEWKEKGKKRLEDHLHECISCVLRAAEAKREAVRQWEEDCRRREREEEERKQREEERRRLQHLENLVENWVRAERIRAFVATAREGAKDEASAQLGEDYLAEALALAHRLDPLQNRLAAVE
jgi:hypothetical protein